MEATRRRIRKKGEGEKEKTRFRDSTKTECDRTNRCVQERFDASKRAVLTSLSNASLSTVAHNGISAYSFIAARLVQH